MITHVKLVGIPVRDQQKALEFYTDKLGFTIIVDQPFNNATDARWIELKTPQGQTRVALLKADYSDPRMCPSLAC